MSMEMNESLDKSAGAEGQIDADASETPPEKTSGTDGAISVPGEQPSVESSAELRLVIGTLVKAVAEMQKEVQQLQRSFDAKIAYDSGKERIIDKLHGELQSYREGLHAKILRPVLTDMVRLHNDLSRVVREAMTGAATTPSEEQLRHNVGAFLWVLEDMLLAQGVQAFETEGNQFVAGRQRVLGTKITEDVCLDGTVALYLRKGFTYEDRVLQPEWVYIYKYQSAVTTPAAPPGPEMPDTPDTETPAA